MYEKHGTSEHPSPFADGSQSARQRVRLFAKPARRVSEGSDASGLYGRGSTVVTLVAAALIVDSQGNVLVTRRPPGKRYAGYWEFPGGKVR